MNIEEVLKDSIKRILEYVEEYKEKRIVQRQEIDSGVLLGLNICLDILKNNMSILNEDKLKEYNLDKIEKIFKDII